MAKSLFLIKGNIFADRVRLARALQKPPITQEELAHKIQFMEMDLTALIISRIEKNQRNICDAELLALSKALNVSIDWLCGEGEELVIK
jgi:transcriptional regulator with XRE-family HTH domain